MLINIRNVWPRIRGHPLHVMLYTATAKSHINKTGFDTYFQRDRILVAKFQYEISVNSEFITENYIRYL